MVRVREEVQEGDKDDGGGTSTDTMCKASSIRERVTDMRKVRYNTVQYSTYNTVENRIIQYCKV